MSLAEALISSRAASIQIGTGGDELVLMAFAPARTPAPARAVPCPSAHCEPLVCMHGPLDDIDDGHVDVTMPMVIGESPRRPHPSWLAP